MDSGRLWIHNMIHLRSTVYIVWHPKQKVPPLSRFPRDAKQNKCSPLGVTESLSLEQVEIVGRPLVSQLYLYIIDGQHAYYLNLGVWIASIGY